ncbi:intraflagellar transport protein 46 homolog isoform X2 [Gigantopelta aegis]|uniref:intraflagellar transport protein 46 homolog isoform X2 n=1 Tax=Gigantopelta aegis TaxID=1735272 RepID=UPI001B88BB12|nr:intraflagellar transport protein 46 homolog isoform X2 [Gigantopelta aegis]
MMMEDDSDDEQANPRVVHHNQPYDESLEVPDAEEIASTYSPTPRVPQPGASDRGMSRDNSILSDQSDEEDDDDVEFSHDRNKGMPPPPQGKMAPPQRSSGPPPQQRQVNDDDDDGDDDGSGDSGDDDDSEEGPPQVEGAYDPADFESLPVTPEIKELFQYITRYTPQSIELEQKLRPFIPDFIPAVGDIDAFIKISRPDQKHDTLGLTVLDEPCAKQSDPTVLDLQLRAISKQTTAKQLVVKSLENAEKNPKHVDNWIESIRELHRSKPPPNVHYSKNMPDIDTLMQEWPPEFEELLKEVGLPTAELDCDLGQYVEIIASMLDIPIYKDTKHHEKIQALHVLFTLYSEFKNSQHFRTLAQENRLDNNMKNENSADTDERLVL